MSAETTFAASRAAAGVRALDVRRFVPAIAGLVLVLPSALWAFLDRSIWPWDPAWYGEVSVDLWATLRTDPGNWGAAMAHAFGAKPPAVAWLGQFFIPLGGLVGDDSTALLFSIVVVQAATLAFVFAACRRLGLSDFVAAVGALLVAASPLFVSMSHEYFAEPMQTLAIAWGLYVLASARRWPIALTAAQIPGIVALGMLAKLSSPAYLTAPVLATVFLAMLGPVGGRARGVAPWRDPRVLASAAVSAVLAYGAISWYRINHEAALEHARLASADTGLYGIDKGFAKQLPEWIGRFRDASFLPHVGFAILALAIASVALVVRRRGISPALDSRLVVAATCLVTIVIVLALFASQPNQEVRYLLGLVPYLAIVVAVALDASSSRRLAVAAAVVLAVEFGLTQLQSFGQTPIASASYPRLVAPTSETPFAKELDDVVDQTCTTESAGKINMVGADHPWFNHNTIEMLAFQRYAESGRRCYYTALGYAEKDPEVAWKRLRKFGSPYYISIDYGNRTNPLPEAQRSLLTPSDPFNRVNTNVYRRVRRSGRYQIVPESRSTGIVILQAEMKAE